MILFYISNPYILRPNLPKNSYISCKYNPIFLLYFGKDLVDSLGSVISKEAYERVDVGNNIININKKEKRTKYRALGTPAAMETISDVAPEITTLCFLSQR